MERLRLYPQNLIRVIPAQGNTTSFSGTAEAAQVSPDRSRTGGTDSKLRTKQKESDS